MVHVPLKQFLQEYSLLKMNFMPVLLTHDHQRYQLFQPWILKYVFYYLLLPSYPVAIEKCLEVGGCTWFLYISKMLCCFSLFDQSWFNTCLLFWLFQSLVHNETELCFCGKLAQVYWNAIPTVLMWLLVFARWWI